MQLNSQGMRFEFFIAARYLRAKRRQARLEAEKVRAVVEHWRGRPLPEGRSEIYFHPATARDEMLVRLMPDYEHVAEFEALLTDHHIR